MSDLQALIAQMTLEEKAALCTGATAWKFGANNALSFTVNSATTITALAPAGSAGTIDVTVTTAGGTSATGSADQFTYTASSNANLSNLTISDGTLSPPFATGTTVYTVSVPYSSSTVTLTPTLQDTTSTVKILGLPVTLSLIHI